MSRRRAPAEVGDARAIARQFRLADSDEFVTSWFNDPLFHSLTDAERAWCVPGVRREVWSQEHRMSVPRPAVVFDHVVSTGWQLMWDSLDGDAAFPLADVRAAVAADRKKVDAFRRRDPIGAQAIGDYLAAVGRGSRHGGAAGPRGSRL